VPSTVYATAVTSADGTVSAQFTMPAVWADGTPAVEDTLTAVVATDDFRSRATAAFAHWERVQ
jgi:hypothetical protein